MQEVWKDIKGYENLYKVSNLGNIYSVKRNRYLKNKLTKSGYCYVFLCKKGKIKKFLIHRLVAFHFLKNPNNLPTINHIDENKTNNCVNNLEYMTHKDNVRYSQAKKVYQYDKSLKLIKLWDSVMDIERDLNIKSGNISNCCNHRRKTTKGYIWSYVPLT